MRISDWSSDVCSSDLHAAGHRIAAVYTQPPRPAQRGKKVQQSAVHDWADAHGLPVRPPKSLKGAEEQAAFAALNLDVAVGPAYGLILPRAVLAAPREGRSEEHTSELQSLMRISYAGCCLRKTSPHTKHTYERIIKQPNKKH